MSLVLLPATMRKNNAKVAAACAIAREEKKRRREEVVGGVALEIAPAVDAPVVAAPEGELSSPHLIEIGAGTLRNTIYQCAKHNQWFEMNLITNPRMFAYMNICNGFVPDDGWTLRCHHLVKKFTDARSFPLPERRLHLERKWRIMEKNVEKREGRAQYREVMDYMHQLVTAGASEEQAQEIVKKRIFQDWPELQDHDIREFVLPRPPGVPEFGPNDEFWVAEGEEHLFDGFTIEQIKARDTRPKPPPRDPCNPFARPLSPPSAYRPLRRSRSRSRSPPPGTSAAAEAVASAAADSDSD